MDVACDKDTPSEVGVGTAKDTKLSILTHMPDMSIVESQGIRTR
jgi:hypothetical protein